MSLLVIRGLLNAKYINMRIAIINGPNLNLQGTRETEIYGKETFGQLLQQWQNKFDTVEIIYFQSNLEGELINCIQECNRSCDAIIINPAGYSHTSVAIADALKAINIPSIEVHISNIYSREVYRHISLTGANCRGVISGLGVDGYALALSYIISKK